MMAIPVATPGSEPRAVATTSTPIVDPYRASHAIAAAAAMSRPPTIVASTSPTGPRSDVAADWVR
jgi:hypothetical protein